MTESVDIQSILMGVNQTAWIQVILIIVAAWIAISLNHYVQSWLSNGQPGRLSSALLALAPIFQLVIICVAISFIIPLIIEPTFENLAAIFGALGLALGFAFKDYVSSLVAGVVTLYEMPYKPGDWVEIDGSYGMVQTIKMRSLRIITPDDTVVIIPHLKIWDKLLFNANDGGPDLQCVADFYLHPRHDAARIKQALYDTALCSAFIQLAKPIHVIVLNKPWGTHYRLKAYPVDMRQQFHFISDLTVRGKVVLAGLEVEFVSMPLGLPENS